MDERTLKKLEFDKVAEMLVECCGSVLGKELARSLAPSNNIDMVGNGLEETTEAKEILRFNPNFSLGGIRDVRKQVERTVIGGILEPEDFLDISGTCAASRKAKVFFSGLKGSYPLVTGLARDLGIFKSIETAVNEAVTPDGGIADSASEQLYTLRRKIRTCQERVKEKLDSFIRSPHTSKYLQDSLVTIRGDRYVIPVKQEYRSQVPGMIHDQSASGATLFIEPLAVLELNNDLKKHKTAEQQEILLILKNLSKLVASFERELLDTLEILGRLDFIFAKGRLSRLMDGGAPAVNMAGNIRLLQARHPLIKGNVVPIDVDLGKDFDAMVITGPNTGGKTVSLKTVGLLTVMGLSGLHLPADHGTEISIFENVFADIGDEQSIEQSLSTFSSHLVNIVQILEKATEKTLVLLDELGAGTDPTEGAALAMAILEFLQNAGVKMIATTHYSELKAFAYNHSRIVNASVEFNVETLRPTYKLLMGVPGKSNAFEIARGLGVPEKIISRSNEFLSKDQVQVADLIANLEMDQRLSERERKEAESLRRELQAIKKRMAEKEAEMHNREADIIREAQDQSLKILKQTREEAEALLTELKTTLDAEAQKAQSYALLKAKEKIKAKEEKIGSAVPEKKYAGKAPKTVIPGQYVEIPKLNLKGHIITKPNQDGELYIQAGIMKVMVKLSDLRLKEEEEKEIGRTRSGHVRMEKIKSISSEIDLRGKTVDESLEELDKYLDDALLAGLNELRIIHGKGTGVLRDAITGYLKKHRSVKSYRLGDFNEGGTGVTRVSLV